MDPNWIKVAMIIVICAVVGLMLGSIGRKLYDLGYIHATQERTD